MNKFLYFFAIFLLLSYISYFSYYFPKLNNIKNELYLKKSFEMKDILKHEIEVKQKKIMNLIHFIIQDKQIIEGLTNNSIFELPYKSVIDNINKQEDFANLWFQIISKEGYSLYRSWTDKKGDLIINFREDLKKIINDPKPVQTISSGIYDLTLKNIYPVYNNGVFVGFVELISKFNSIAKILKYKNIEPVFLLNEKYSKRLKFPFTNIFIKGIYVANYNASEKILSLIEDFGLDSFLVEKDYLIKQNYIVTLETIKDVNNEDLGYFLLFFNKEDINTSKITEFQINYLLALVIFGIIAVLIFLYYVKTSYAKELDKEVQIQTKKITEQKKRLKSMLEIYDRNVIFSKTDLQGIITHTSSAFCRISGYTKKELIGKPHNIVRHPDMPKEVFKNIWNNLQAEKRISAEIKNLKKDGSYYWVLADFEPDYDENGKHIGYFSIREDITASKEIEEIQKEIIFTIGSIAEFRSKETAEHVNRVAKYSTILAKAYGLSKEEIVMIELASPMHDIGKFAVPDSILNKPGKLTEEEFEIIKSHTWKGFEMLHVSERPLFKAAAEISLTHHEKYDGSGYPRGLKGEEIPIFGRITALADVFDALSSDRCYKKAWETNEVLKYIEKEKGKHFDPKLVDIFFDNLDKILDIKEKYKDS